MAATAQVIVRVAAMGRSYIDSPDRFLPIFLRPSLHALV